ncbi:MAG: D-tyrosyl-tRNA(Tyr) deacylase [Elusimicrobia bacterium]|nr:D-tyrosyl-tRNA(Tyr) deacylase [Elusimicrobiota bacterium]
MRALIQRVNSASVTLPDGEKRAISKGLLIFLGIGERDDSTRAARLCDKVLNLRIFPNSESKFDKSVLDIKGEVLVISQFTLYGDPWSGRRPDFTSAAQPEPAKKLYEEFVSLVRSSNLTVKAGEFAAHMLIESVNDGPVTIWAEWPPGG